MRAAVLLTIYEGNSGERTVFLSDIYVILIILLYTANKY